MQYNSETKVYELVYVARSGIIAIVAETKEDAITQSTKLSEKV
jgi:hypothetical protein